MSRSISGVPDVFLQRCWKGSPFSQERIVRHRLTHALMDLFILSPDVNQFSIITELLGTPPDDVIETICSENVRCNNFY